MLNIPPPLFFSSANASRKNLAKGEAEFFLEEDIDISSGNTSVCAVSMAFVNSFPNITAAIGNNKIYYTDDAKDETKYSITIPDGVWSLDDLDEFLTTYQTALGTNIFELLANYATGKVGILFDATTTGYFIYFDTDSPFTLLGFASAQSVPDFTAVPGGNVVNYVEYGAAVAAFNNISVVKIGTSITSQSFSNNSKSNVILQAAITAEPLSTQVYEPRHLIKVPILSGGKIRRITLYLYDQNNDQLLVTDDFSVTLIFVEN